MQSKLKVLRENGCEESQLHPWAAEARGDVASAQIGFELI